MASRKSARSQLFDLLDIAERVHERSRRAAHEREQSLAWVRECRELAKSPGAGAAGLRSLERDFMVEWNEGVGAEVEEFWREVGEAGLPVPRKKDVVVDTLARGRVASMADYTELEDNFEILQTCGKIDAEQAGALNRMLDAFAEDPKHRIHFEDAAGEPDAPQPGHDGVEVGQLVRVSDSSYRYDYFGRERAEELRRRGHQGGGETWASIARALLEMHAPELIAEVRFDPEADCLAVWAAAPEPLGAVSQLIARALRERKFFAEAVAHAEANLPIE